MDIIQLAGVDFKEIKFRLQVLLKPKHGNRFISHFHRWMGKSLFHRLALRGIQNCL